MAAYVRGLLAPLERKNGWAPAEQAWETIPDGMQRLSASADWDAGAVRDDLRGYVVEHLGDPREVLVVDETGFVKKGNRSAGVARQSLGHREADRELPDRSVSRLRHPGRAHLVDRELYLPQAWTDDRGRCTQAGVPAEVGFATNPELPIRMLAGAMDAGMSPRWVTADEVYGSHTGLRRFREERSRPYVMGISTSQRLRGRHGPRPRPSAPGSARRRAARPGRETDLRRGRGQGPPRLLVRRLIWSDQPDPPAVLRWSRWRRRHQAGARCCRSAAPGASLWMGGVGG